MRTIGNLAATARFRNRIINKEPPATAGVARDIGNNKVAYRTTVNGGASTACFDMYVSMPRLRCLEGVA